MIDCNGQVRNNKSNEQVLGKEKVEEGTHIEKQNKKEERKQTQFRKPLAHQLLENKLVNLRKQNEVKGKS